jgi:prepilin-type N-terminal cleavage/methylation domain-containing protein
MSKVRLSVLRRSPSDDRAERGLTLLEVIVALAILGVIIVPLTTSLVRALQQNKAVADRLARSADAQRIGAAWTQDVESLDRDGANNKGTCPGLRTGDNGGQDLITFYSDLGSVDPTSGLPQLKPKSVTWSVKGTGDSVTLFRKTCENGSPKAEAFLATHLGKAGSSLSGTDIVHGPAGPGDTNFCDNSSCTLSIDGDFKYTIQAARRVPGAVNNLNTPGKPTCTNPPTPGNHMLTDTWTAPSGTAPILGYHIEAWPASDQSGQTVAGSADVTATSTVADITGLDNNVDYVIVVYAYNENGQGAGSTPCGPARPAPSLPGIPASVTATPGPVINPLQVDVSWTAPLDPGGTTITGYEVSIFDNTGAIVGSPKAVNSGLSTSMTGLQPDTTYTVQVRAQNSVGWGPLSDPVTANTRPPKPVVTRVDAGNNKAIVTYTVSNNGNVNLSDTNAVRITANCASGNTLSCSTVVYNLDHESPAQPNGTFHQDTGGNSLLVGRTYTFQVELMNTDGNYGPPSDVSAAATANTVGAPDVPTRMGFEPYGYSQVVLVRIPAYSQALMEGTAANNYNDRIIGFKVKNQESGGVTPLVPVDPNNVTAQLTFGWASADSPFVAPSNPNPQYASVPGTNFTDFVEYHFAVSACNLFGCSAFSPYHRGSPAIDAVQSQPAIANNAALKVTVAYNFIPGYGRGDDGVAGGNATRFEIRCYRAVVPAARTFNAIFIINTTGVIAKDGTFTQADVGVTITSQALPGGATIVSVQDATHATISKPAPDTYTSIPITLTPQALLTGYPLYGYGPGSVTGPTSGLQRGESVYCTVYASTRVTGTSFDATHSYDDTFGLGGQTMTTGTEPYIYEAPTALESVPPPTITGSGSNHTLTFTPVKGASFDSGGTNQSVKYRVVCSIYSNDSAYGASTVVLTGIPTGGYPNCQVYAINIQAIGGPATSVPVVVGP